MPDVPAVGYIQPTWAGYPDDVSGLVRAIAQSAAQRHAANISKLTMRIGAVRAEIDSYPDLASPDIGESYRLRISAGISDSNARLSRLRAQLRELEAVPVVAISEERAAADLEFMRNLPGVLGMRVDEHGRVVAHIRTGIDHEGQRYDLGDFEAIFGEAPEPHRWTLSLHLVCTRSGLQEVSGGEYAYPFYWMSDGGEADTTGPGWFCFGTRGTAVQDCLRAGRYAEALHLVIATMNSVNRTHRSSLGVRYNTIPQDPASSPDSANNVL